MNKKISVNSIFIISVLVAAAIVLLTWLIGGRLESVSHLPDEGAHWYYFRGYEKLYEVSFIPVALYGGGLALILLMKLFSGRKRQNNNDLEIN